ncbi:MAG: HAD-IA family hydrolase [Burkholderiaceae bacterium]
MSTIDHPPIDLIVFDWDGTLIDSTRAITQAMRLAAIDVGLQDPGDERASHTIGLGLADALAHAVPDLSREKRPAYIERYKHHFLRQHDALSPFEGIPQMLDALQAAGVPLAIATGKSRIGLNRSLEQATWLGRFVTTRCADEGEPKPHPWMLRDICEELGLELSRVLMVGDTTHDLGMARTAGAHALGVTYGAHPAEQLSTIPALGLVDSVAQLHAWLTLAAATNGR